MRFLVVILAVISIGVVVAAAVKHDTIDIDVSTIKPPTQKLPINSGDDDDDDASGDVQGDDASASGSGQTTTKPPTTKEVYTRVIKTESAKSTKKPTKMAMESTERIVYTDQPRETEMSTEKVVVVKRDKTTEPPSERVVTVKPTTENDDMLGGGVSKDGDVAARKSDEEALNVLTTEVIAAVVVGGVCAIILIAFLVYRLRKRDEGSYILTDTGYKDTNKLRGDTGKEAFV